MFRRLHLMVLAATVVGLQALSPLAQAQLTHRWSFDGDADDSVGSANWTVNGATFSSGEVVFDGVDDLLTLASNPLPSASNSSTTIEVWGTYDPASPLGSRIFDFSRDSGDYYFYMTPNSNQGDTRVGWDDDFNLEFGPTTAPTNTGEQVLLTLVFDAAGAEGAGEFRLYQNAAQVATLSGESLDILGSLAGGTENYLGFGESNTTPANPVDQDNPPAYLQGSINEFRIHGNVLTGNDILTNALAGPDRADVTLSSNSWTGGSDNWNSAGNWSGEVPGIDDRATIGNGGEAIVSSDVPMVGGLTIANGTLSVIGDGTGGGLIGDYNEDELVNAADYVAYRNAEAAGATTLPNRDPANDGPVGAGDYDSWVDNFGNAPGSGSGGMTGSLDIQFPLELSPGAANSATININNGGRLSVGAIVPDAAEGAKTINFDGGTLASNFAAAVVQPGIAVNIGAGGATIDTPDGNAMTWTLTADELSPDLGFAGSGIVTKTGLGRLNLYTTTPGNRAMQNSSFTGEFHVDEGTVDIAGNSGVFGRAGTRGFGEVTMTDSTLLVNSGGGTGREFGADLHIVGDNVISNQNAGVRELRMQGSISGDGTLRFRKPNVANASGLDFEIFDLVAFPDVTNENFTGRIVIEGNYALRFRSGVQNSPVDFPNAILELADAGSWVGKRGPDGDATLLEGIVELGGVESVGPVEDPANPGTFFYPRLEACVAGCGTGTNPQMIYHIGGATEDAEFRGIIQDNGATDTVVVVKVGDNTQTFSGPNTYSGTTTVDGGTLLVNGTHEMNATTMLPVGDYTVNGGGTLGGSGTIGSVADTVDVAVDGGTLAPGDGIGTLTVMGGVSFTGDATLAVELEGSLSDLLVANSLNLAGGSDSLDVNLLGAVDPGDYVIYMGGLTGEFENVTGGFAVAYGANSITLTVPAGAGAGSVIPEPGTLLLMCVAAALAGFRRQR